MNSLFSQFYYIFTKPQQQIKDEEDDLDKFLYTPNLPQKQSTAITPQQQQEQHYNFVRQHMIQNQEFLKMVPQQQHAMILAVMQQQMQQQMLMVQQQNQNFNQMQQQVQQQKKQAPKTDAINNSQTLQPKKNQQIIQQSQQTIRASQQSQQNNTPLRASQNQNDVSPVRIGDSQEGPKFFGKQNPNQAIIEAQNPLYPEYKPNVQSDYNPNNNGFNQDKLKTQSMGRDSQARLATQSTDLGTQPTIQVNNVQAPHNQDYQNMNAPNQVQIQQNQQQPVNYLAPQLQHQNSLQMRQQQQQMQYQNQYQQFQNSDNAQVPGMQNYPIPQYSQQKAFMANRNQNHLANQQPARYKKPNNFSYFNENPLHKAPWNERFFVTSVLNNAIPNNFFREFFDKPQRQRIDTMIQPDKPEIPIEEFYRSSSLSQLLFDSAEKKQSRNNESARGTFRQSLGSRLGKRSSTQSASISRGQLRRAQSQKNLLVAEFNWDEKFNIMASKNNIQVHKNYQEYFDKPIEYDARGYAYSRKQEPLRVYDPKTPIMRSPFYMSTKRKREVSEILQNYEATKRFATPPIMYRTGTDYRNKPVTASSTFTNKRMLSTASTNKGSRNSDKNMRLQKTGWSERIGLPISTYNQTVFPRYKILFDHL